MEKKKVKNKKQIKVLKYEEHPEFVGNEIEVGIINNEKRKPIVKSKIAPRKPKQPRMTINQLAGTVNQLASIVNNLAVEMRAGFAAVNQRIDGLERRIDKLEENDKQIFTRLDKLDDKVENISDVLVRNNLK
jgi:polyhydroxyalkanoate synthesis regulator phasin